MYDTMLANGDDEQDAREAWYASDCIRFEDDDPELIANMKHEGFEPHGGEWRPI